MKKIFFSVLIIITFSSFRWPSNDGRITSTFGEYRPDHFHDGVDLISNNFNVYPVADGETLYTWNKELFPFDNYTGSGNYKIILHGQVASVYLHLEDNANVSKTVYQDKTIGHFANTGRSFGNHIHFSIFNIKNWTSVNPISLMPKHLDLVPPDFSEIAFYIDGHLSIVKNNATIRLTKNHPLLVKIIDTVKKGDRLGVYSLKAFHNGKEIYNIKFDSVCPQGDDLLVGGKSFNSVYCEGYYKIDGIKWVSGENTFKIIATDFSGNESSADYSLIANTEF